MWVSFVCLFVCFFTKLSTDRTRSNNFKVEDSRLDIRKNTFFCGGET